MVLKESKHAKPVPSWFQKRPSLCGPRRQTDAGHSRLIKQEANDLKTWRKPLTRFGTNFPGWRQGQATGKDPQFPSKQKYLNEGRIRSLPIIILRKRHSQGQRPQPLLFIIMTYIPNPCKGVELFMYAENIARWTIGTSSRAMTTCIQKQLNNTAKYLSANGFKISSSKSQAILFTSSSVKRSEANIGRRIGKEIIPLSPKATFLGIVLVAKLNWSLHAEAVKTRCMKRLNAMRAISGSSWGTNKSNLLQVYRVTIRSPLDCGDRPEVQTHQGRLQQDPVLSTENLLWWHEGNECFPQVECGELPLDLRRKKLMANHTFRSTATKNMSLKNNLFLMARSPNLKRCSTSGWRNNNNNIFIYKAP